MFRAQASGVQALVVEPQGFNAFRALGLKLWGLFGLEGFKALRASEFLRLKTSESQGFAGSPLKSKEYLTPHKNPPFEGLRT